MQLFLKILSRMANSVDPDWTDLGLHCLHITFFRHFGVANFRTFTILEDFPWGSKTSLNQPW